MTSGTPTSEATDVVVVGMGPAGEAVAGSLAEAGLRVIGIDRELVGGECPYWGCVPSKMMVRAANALAEARRIPGLAGEVRVEPDWGQVATRIRDEATDNWDDKVAVDRFETKGGRFVRGHGRLTGPDSVAVEDRTFIAGTAIVIATGASAVVPPISGLEAAPFWTNRDVIEAEELPTSLIVLGGGAIGVELAQALARFGVRITIIEAKDRLLANEEPEAGQLVAAVFEREGLDVRLGVRAHHVAHDGDRFTVTLDDGSAVTAERLLVATGRRPDLAAVGVDSIGVDVDAGAVPVDDHLRVRPGVWAVGDITGKGAFTHVGMYQARIAAASILGDQHEPADYRALPHVTFADPEIGSVGLTEAAARNAGLEVAVGTTQLSATARGWIHGVGNDGLIKLVADRRAGHLVGATTVGPNGGEVIGLLALAIHARVPLTSLRTMIYAYPTFHRGIEDALRDLGR
jgi:pyruvate/2-oxoglutarate dehydrogenase complex dihydrolipoamide dehydrogenase (E3) component